MSKNLVVSLPFFFHFSLTFNITDQIIKTRGNARVFGQYITIGEQVIFRFCPSQRLSFMIFWSFVTSIRKTLITSIFTSCCLSFPKQALIYFLYTPYASLQKSCLLGGFFAVAGSLSNQMVYYNFRFLLYDNFCSVLPY